MDDPITVGRIKAKTPCEIIKKDRHRILKLIKEGLSFDDEVLKAAGIKKVISNVRMVNSVCDHKQDDKKLPKDKMPLDKILDILSTAEKEKMKSDE